ncbi:hypothetical protein BH23VER1_BH23VER1_15520 [soil metagenome]
MPPEAQRPDIRDIVMPDPVSLSGGASLPALLMVLVAIGLLVAAIVWIILRARRPRPPKLPPAPDAAARRALDHLEQESADLPAEAIAERLGQAVAVFLHRRHGVPALYRTAVELSRQRSPGHPPPLPQIRAFAPLLGEIESIKFASPNRQKDRALAAIHQARQLLQEPVRD